MTALRATTPAELAETMKGLGARARAAAAVLKLAAAERKSAALRAAAHFGLLFTGVDLIESDEGYRVLEVSAFGGFRGLLDGCRIDAAPLVAAAVLRRVRER